VKRLKAEHLQSFWYFSSSICLAIIGTFAGILCATSRDGQVERDSYISKLAEYRWVLRLSATGAEFMKYAVGVLDMRSHLLEQQFGPAVPSRAQQRGDQSSPDEEEDDNDSGTPAEEALTSPGVGSDGWQQRQDIMSDPNFFDMTLGDPSNFSIEETLSYTDLFQ
jgi:hypothetical protein